GRFTRPFRPCRERPTDVPNRVADVRALRPAAGRLRVMVFGTDRAGGGAFERPRLALSVFDTDGLLTRLEEFDVGHEAEALARFDELAAEAAVRPGQRRVRPNAATAHAARPDAASAAP